MIHAGRELVLTEDRLCLSCGYRGHMSEWKVIKRYQGNCCPNCGRLGKEVVVMDEPELEEKRVLNG